MVRPGCWRGATQWSDTRLDDCQVTAFYGTFHMKHSATATLAKQRLFTQTAGPPSCGSATGVIHRLLRAFTGAGAVPKINKCRMFAVEMFISEIQRLPVMFKLRVSRHTTCVSVAGTLVARPHSGPCESSRSRSERYVLERIFLLHYTPLLFIIYNPLYIVPKFFYSLHGKINSLLQEQSKVICDSMSENT
jgi:hypothetical protein